MAPLVCEIANLNMVGFLEPTRQDIQEDPYFHYTANPYWTSCGAYAYRLANHDVSRDVNHHQIWTSLLCHVASDIAAVGIQKVID